MKIESIISTTHIDRHGMMMTKEALYSMAESINGNRKTSCGVEHDMTLPPMGKVIGAKVEQAEDGEYQVVAIQEIFEGYEQVRLPDGTVAYKQESKTDRSPFYKLDDAPADTKVSCDPNNFESPEARRRFLEEVNQGADEDIVSADLLRKSWLPDPEIVFQVGEAVITYLTAKKVIDKVGDKIIDAVSQDIANFYSTTRSAIMKMAKYAFPKNRPTTYVFDIAADPNIQLVAKTSGTNLVLSSIQEDKLRDVVSKAQHLRETLHAEKVQFLLEPDGTWGFNYLLTTNGAVIGTPKSFSRRTRQLELTAPDLAKLTNPNNTERTNEGMNRAERRKKKVEKRRGRNKR